MAVDFLITAFLHIVIRTTIYLPKKLLGQVLYSKGVLILKNLSHN